MNEHVDEKSDEAVVPVNSSNKGEESPAEAVEGRTLPEGNSDQTASVRTQSRVTASNFMMAVRRAREHDVDTRCLMYPLSSVVVCSDAITRRRSPVR